MERRKLSGGELKPSGAQAFDAIAQALRLTGGFTLAQLCEVARIEGSTIQNWVKRGWIESPVNKLYPETSVARVLIINMLRSSLQLSEITGLMSYVNGLVNDRNDDIIPDSVLYNKLCKIIDEVREKNMYGKGDITKIIANCLSDYREPHCGAREKLESALLVMTLAYIGSELRNEAQRELKKIKEPLI